MNCVYLAKSAVSSGIGDSLKENWDNLCQGVSAIKKITYFNVENIDYQNAAFKEKLWHSDNHFTMPATVPKDVPNRVCMLTKQVLDSMGEFPEDTFIIWTGVKGNVEYIENNFKNKMPHLPHHYRKWVCDYINRPEAKGMEINAACASSTIGIILGSMAISSGLYSSVLVCAADIVSSFVHMGFSSLKALTKTKAKPFDKNRDGLNLGDGAVASLLVNEEVAQKMEIGERIRVTGWGISNDANHITGPARDGCGLIEAMQGALRVAGKKPEDIEAFCAHGTSTVYNDAMELYATDFIFKDRKFPVFSIKGSIGHTLGAAGAIEAAISAESLKKGIIPPTVGLSDPEDSAVGRVSDSVTPIPGNNILTTNSGFGGVNAALILEKE